MIRKIINIIEVIAAPLGKLNPPWNNAKNTELSPPLKKFAIFSQNFQLIPSTLPAKIETSATPNGIASTVAANIPQITEPLTL